MKKKNLSAKKRILNFYSKKLDNPKIRNIYSNFKKDLTPLIKTNLCVAVSGGADSLALSFLAKCYSIEKKKDIYFFIVDHNLRKNSSLEAKTVRSKLKNFQINCEILTLKKVNKSLNLQSFARNNRYKLISKQALKKKSDTILTAHHRDDLLENFFIRLLRGSGLRGLISLAKIRSKIKFDDKISILRPLINVSKKDLIYISKETFNFKIEDPSNLDDKFLRVKVRKLIANLEREGLSFKKFKISLNNLSKSNNALNYFVKKNIHDNSNYIGFNKNIILKEEFLSQPDEIAFRSLSEVIQKVGKKQYYTRGVKLKNLIENLRSSKKYKKKTLSGCIIQKIQKSVIISPENR